MDDAPSASRSTPERAGAAERGLPDPVVALDPQLLRTLTVYADSGSRSAAAAALGVHRSVVGRRLAELERSLGTPLFTRSAGHGRPGVELTAAGLVLVEETRDLLARHVRVVTRTAAAAHHFAAPARRLTVAVLAGEPRARVEALVAALRQRAPAAEVGVLPLPYRELLASVRDGRSQLALTWLPMSAEQGRGLRFAPWAHVRRVALVPAGHPLAARDTVGVPDLVREPFAGFDAEVDPVFARYWTLRDQQVAATTDASRPVPGPLVGRARTVEDNVGVVASGRAVAVAPAGVGAACGPTVTVVAVAGLAPARAAVAWHQARNPQLAPLVRRLVAAGHPALPVASGQ